MRHRGFPTPKGARLVVVRLRLEKGWWVVAAEDADQVPVPIPWTHNERGLPVYSDGSPIGRCMDTAIGAQKLMPGDTLHEMYRSFSLGSVTQSAVRVSKCEPDGAPVAPPAGAFAQKRITGLPVGRVSQMSLDLT